MRRGRGPRGRGRGAGQCGAGAERLRPRFGPSVSSRAGARAGHGGLCGPAGLGRGQPLVVPLANRGPRAEVALCGGWNWGLPTSGDHDDAEAPLVPVRDGARGRTWSPGSVFRPARRPGGQEAGPAEGDWSSTRERVPAGSRPALPGMCARNREGSAAQSPGLRRTGSEGELVTLPERILPPGENPTSPKRGSRPLLLVGSLLIKP